MHRKIAYSIGHSPLVKTAFFASDPNLGRILAAIGYAGVDDLDVSKLNLYLDDVWVAKNGGRNPDYQEADGQRVMKQSEITVRVQAGARTAAAGRLSGLVTCRMTMSRSMRITVPDMLSRPRVAAGPAPAAVRLGPVQSAAANNIHLPSLCFASE